MSRLAPIPEPGGYLSPVGHELRTVLLVIETIENTPFTQTLCQVELVVQTGQVIWVFLHHTRRIPVVFEIVGQLPVPKVVSS